MVALGLHHAGLLGRRETVFLIVPLKVQGKVFIGSFKLHAYLEGYHQGPGMWCSDWLYSTTICISPGTDDPGWITSPEPLVGADRPKWSWTAESKCLVRLWAQQLCSAGQGRNAEDSNEQNVVKCADDVRGGVPTGSPECNQLAAFANSSTCHISSSLK